MQATPVIAIGASAGSLSAIEALFDGVPETAPLVFVLVQHLSPDFRSHMVELLERRTQLPISVAEGRVHLEPSHVYLTPPRSMARFEGDDLIVEVDKSGGIPFHPIDHLLSSLAEQACRKMAIVLSGTGTDGASGIAAIREAGGLVVSQSLETAAFDGMPRAAIDSGAVHIALSPEAISQMIVHPDFGFLSISDVETLCTTWEALQEITELVRQSTGVDLEAYRQGTVLRRIKHFSERFHNEPLVALRDELHANPEAAEQLLEDILIPVTEFFRDDYAWSTLGHAVIPQVVDQFARSNNGQGEIRVWVAACSYGQEAYSVALLFAEQLEGMENAPSVRIFATDVSDARLREAEAGRFTAEQMTGLSLAHIEKYFTQTGEGFTASKALRSMLSFSRLNLLSDPPLSAVDLVLCRNLIIYFIRSAQETCLAKLEYSLRSGGFLFLGSSEDPGPLKSSLRTIGAKTHIYRKEAMDRGSPLPMSSAQLGAGSYPNRRAPTRPAGSGSDEIYARALELLVSRGALIDRDGLLLHSFGALNDVVSMQGAAPFNLLELLPDRAAAAITSALSRATSSAPNPVEALLPRGGETSAPSDLAIVRALEGTTRARGAYLIEFVTSDELAVENATDVSATSSKGGTARLQRELETTKKTLDSALCELKLRYEEHQTVKEELTASNEELQSSNEEIQSVNEELRTLNEELQRRMRVHQDLANDLENLLKSTDVGVIFLDMDLCIRDYNPASTRLFRLRRHDIGRDINDVRSAMDPSELRHVADRIIGGAELVEDSVESDESSFLIRATPYRSETKIVIGLVLTIVDVTDLKQVERDLREREEYYVQCLEETGALVQVVDASDRLVRVSDSWLETFGYEREDVLLKPVQQYFDVESRRRLQQAGSELSKSGDVESVQIQVVCKDGRLAPTLFSSKKRVAGAGQNETTLGILRPVRG